MSCLPILWILLNKNSFWPYEASPDDNETKTVQSAFVKFEGLLYETKLSPLKAQKFSIKIEIDTKPPKGGCFNNANRQ